MITLGKHLGIFIKSKRLEHTKRYSQADLAALLGVKGQYISNVERGLQSMRVKYLLKLCTILNVEFKEFHDEMLKDMSDAIWVEAQKELNEM